MIGATSFVVYAIGLTISIFGGESHWFGSGLVGGWGACLLMISFRDVRARL